MHMCLTNPLGVRPGEQGGACSCRCRSSDQDNEEKRGPQIPPYSPEAGHSRIGAFRCGYSHSSDCGGQTSNCQKDEEEEEEEEEEEADNYRVFKLCGRKGDTNRGRLGI